MYPASPEYGELIASFEALPDESLFDVVKNGMRAFRRMQESQQVNLSQNPDDLGQFAEGLSAIQELQQRLLNEVCDETDSDEDRTIMSGLIYDVLAEAGPEDSYDSLKDLFTTESPAQTEPPTNDSEVVADMSPRDTKPEQLEDISDISLVALAQSGDQAAVATLVKRHSGIVYKYAHRIANAHYRNNRHFDANDLAQEGFIVLIKAIKAYNVDGSRAKLITYAFKGIYHRMNDYVDNSSSTIRLPVEHRQEVRRMLAESWRVYGQHQGVPDHKRMAAILGTTPEHVQRLWLLYAMTVDMGSLDVGYAPDRDVSSNDTYERTGVKQQIYEDMPKDVDEAVERVLLYDLSRSAAQALGTLSGREQEILKLRFGVGNNYQMTLKEVAREFGLTQERIRQIEAKTLAKMRRPNGPLRDLAPDSRMYHMPEYQSPWATKEYIQQRAPLIRQLEQSLLRDARPFERAQIVGTLRALKTFDLFDLDAQLEGRFWPERQEAVEDVVPKKINSQTLKDAKSMDARLGILAFKKRDLMSEQEIRALMRVLKTMVDVRAEGHSLSAITRLLNEFYPDSAAVGIREIA